MQNIPAFYSFKNDLSNYIITSFVYPGMEDQRTTPAADEFNITPIVIKELALNSAKMDVILQLQVEILGILQARDRSEIFAGVNESIKELTLEWYVQNSIKK
ncbi:hypothetical protein ACFGVR_05280 [Mucilaginibacter sp. AW1-3]